MGTLGCINDMMRRDKENRELRRASRERLNETRNRLLDVKGKRSECNVSYEQLEHIAHETREWEEKERNSFLKGKLVFITLLAGIVLLIGTVLALFWQLLPRMIRPRRRSSIILRRKGQDTVPKM